MRGISCGRDASKRIARVRLKRVAITRFSKGIAVLDVLCIIFTVLNNSQGSVADPLHTSDASSVTQRLFLRRIRAADHTTILSVEAIHAELQSRVQQSSVPKRNSEPLVVKNDRIDPLDHFRKYEGGYAVQSKHYLASTVFTGVHGYVVGAIWLVAGIVAIVCILCRRRTKIEPSVGKQHGDVSHSTRNDFVLLVSTILLAALTIACCGAILAENQHFHTTAKKVETTIIIDGAQNAAQMISKVTSVMGQIRIEIARYDKDIAKRLNTTTATLNKAAIALVETVHNHKETIDTALKVWSTGVGTIASINVAVCILGLACSLVFPKLRRFFYWIIAVAWFLIFLNWIVFGLTFAVSNFADDTCEALKEYIQQTSRNTTLDSILPCDDLAAGNKTFIQMRQKLYNYIIKQNTAVSKHNNNAEVKTIQGPAPSFIPFVCNPFSGPPNYIPINNCSSGTIKISDLPQLLNSLRCPVGGATNTTIVCIPDSVYNPAVAYSAAAENLLTLIPEMESLTNCSFVVETFSIIVRQQCRPLKSSTKIVWIAMVTLSTLMIVNIVLWLVRIHVGTAKFNLSPG